MALLISKNALIIVEGASFALDLNTKGKLIMNNTQHILEYIFSLEVRRDLLCNETARLILAYRKANNIEPITSKGV